MSIALKTRPRKVRPSVGPESYAGHLPPDDRTSETVPTPIVPTPPAAPTPPEPTLQETIAAPTPPAPTPAAPTPPEPSGDVPTSELNVALADLRVEIRSHGKEILGWFAARGAIVSRAIDTLIRKSVNNPTRVKNRKAALTAALVTATDAYDATSEPVPNVELWVKLHWLVKLCPSAVDIHAVDSARAAVVMLTRVDPPTTFGEAEAWVVKDAYRDKVKGIVARVIAERLDFDGTKALVDQVAGIGDGVAPKAKAKRDSIVASHTAAARTAKAFTEAKIDPETFFDDLKSVLERYGWHKATNGRSK